MPMAYPTTVIIDLVEKERAKAAQTMAETPNTDAVALAYLDGAVEAYTAVLAWFGRD